MRLLRALWMQIRGSEVVAYARPKRDGDRAKRGWVAETVTAQGVLTRGAATRVRVWLHARPPKAEKPTLRLPWGGGVTGRAGPPQGGLGPR